MTRANLLLSLLCAGASTLLSSALPAQTPSAPATLAPLLTHRPHQGLWWNPARDGNYYLISTGPSGLTYVTTNLQIDGKSQSYVLIGQLAETQGARAVLRSKLYQRTGGSLVPTVGDSLRTEELGDAELRFSTSTTATLTLPGGKVESIETFPLYLSAETSPAGRLQNDYFAAVRTASADSVRPLTIGPVSNPVLIPSVSARCGVGSLALQATSVEFRDLEVISLSQRTSRYQVLDAAQGCRAVGSLQRVDDALELDLPERGVQAVLYPAKPSALPRTANGLPIQAGLYWTPGVDGYFWHMALSPEGFAYTSLNAFGLDRRQDYRVLQGPIAPALGVPTLNSPIYGVTGGSAPGTANTGRIAVQQLGQASIGFENDLRARYAVDGSSEVRANLEKLILATPPLSPVPRTWLAVNPVGVTTKAVRLREVGKNCGQPSGETLMEVDQSGLYLGVSPGSVRMGVYKHDQITPILPATCLRFACVCNGAGQLTIVSGAFVCLGASYCGASGTGQFTDTGVDLISNGSLSGFYPLPQDWRE